MCTADTRKYHGSARKQILSISHTSTLHGAEGYELCRAFRNWLKNLNYWSGRPDAWSFQTPLVLAAAARIGRPTPLPATAGFSSCYCGSNLRHVFDRSVSAGSSGALWVSDLEATAPLAAQGPDFDISVKWLPGKVVWMLIKELGKEYLPLFFLTTWQEKAELSFRLDD